MLNNYVGINRNILSYQAKIDTTAKIYTSINNNKLIVSFSGQKSRMDTIVQFEFVKFLAENFNNYDRHFYLDKYCKWYHRGIDKISTNIDETILYLKNIIDKYDEVIFIGNSAGGYAAILFGSLLNIDKVIAFKPQTILEPQIYIDDKYINLQQHINSTTKYYIFGDINIDKSNDYLHHILHCNNINIYPNVILNTNYELDLKKLRDNGILLEIMNSIINNK